MMFLEVGGGLGIEEAVKFAGSFYSLVAIVMTPLLVSVPMALITAELATLFPDNGGQVLWADRGLGKFWSFMAGCMTVLASVVDVATLAMMTCDIGVTFLNMLPIQGSYSEETIHSLVGFGITLVGAGINLRSTTWVANLSVGIAALAIVPLVLLALLCGPFLNSAVWLRVRDPAKVDKGRFLSILLWNFSGYEMSGSCAGEVESPSEIFPWALTVCVLLSTLSYLLPVAMGLCAPVAQNEQEWQDGFLFSGIAPSVGGVGFGLVSSGCAAASAFGMLTTTITVGSREIQFMAQNNQLPKALKFTDPQFKTPTNAILAVLIGAAVNVFMPFDELVAMANVAGALSYLVQFASFIRLRQLMPDAPRPFAVPLGTRSCCAMLLPAAVAFTVSATVLTTRMLAMLGVYISCIVLCYVRCVTKEASANTGLPDALEE
eukprot:TRINITY_DN4690_c0_g1_i9.p1 TRINITY_DN4690_c0_g1~~TRINITY_DN4690_c0_g1_i9.p1  ORF type:complete len:433 (+),score=77.43 TRINITY_DN4690_c0_g1_i9:227-1525(+)